MNPILKRLYEAIPTFECKPGCTDCCGPVPFSRSEWAAVVVKKSCKKGSLNCPYSLKGGCEIYKDRPFICRIFGASDEKQLQCPHGCRPATPLSVERTRELTAEYMGLMKRGG